MAESFQGKAATMGRQSVCTRIVHIALTLLYWFVIPGVLVASGVVIPKTDRPKITSQIREEIGQYNAVTTFPLPLLEDARLSNLFDGEVVRVHDKWQFS